MHISAQEIVPTRYGEWMTNAELIPQFSEQQGGRTLKISLQIRILDQQGCYVGLFRIQ
jgi:hypothetical protein